jgi:formate hydrogenlyase subunit 3/multisubunit Na+/H+ antiporter MnhD subunit
MIPAPLLLPAGMVLVAAIVYIIRRVTLIASLLSTATAIGFVWLVNAIPAATEEAILGGWVSGGEQIILGRALVLSPADRPVLIALGLAAAALFLLAGALPRPDDIFFPGLLALLGVTTAILVTETFVFQVLLVEIAVGVTTAIIQGSRFGSTRGAWRFFLFGTLAMPFLLIAGWQIDFQAANPGQTDLLNPAVLLLTLGFAIYLTAVPFHLWVAPTAGEAHPLVQVVVMGLFQVVTVSVIVSAFEQFPWFADSEVPYQWFTFLGTLTVGLGAILAFTSASFGQLAGYSLLVDMGGLLLLLGLKSENGLLVAWALILARIASLTVWGAGLSIIRKKTRSDQIEQAAGWGHSSPLAAAVLVMGGLALAGFPLTPGFPTRWMAAGLVAQESLGRATMLLLGSASGAIGVLRMAKTLFTTRSEPLPESPINRWGWLTTVALVIVLFGAITVALNPNPIMTAAEQIASYFAYLK